MAIRGSLSEASLADVLQLLALGQKTGVLSLAREGSFGTVHFHRGAIWHAALVNRRDRLGDRLVRAGVLDADVLARRQAALPDDDDRRLAEVLLHDGAVDPDVLAREYRVLIEEVVCQLFTWSAGTFAFEPLPAPTLTVAVALPADSLLMEAARRVDEWTQIEKKIPSLDLIFELDVNRLQQSGVTLKGTQEGVAAWLDGTHDVSAIVERSGLGEFAVGKAVYELVTAGFAQRVGRSSARHQPAPESRVAEHRNLGVAFYGTGMFDEALREFRHVLELRADDLGARFHLGLVHLRRQAWADAIEVLARAASQPDTQRPVQHALAYAYERSGQLELAESTLAAASRGGAEEDPRVALSQGVVAMKRGDLARADERLSTARTLWAGRQPAAVWFHHAGLVAALRGDVERAAALLEEGIALHPHATVLYNDLAVAQERRGLHEAAARTLEVALLEEGSLPHVHKNQGDYYYRAQRYDEAFEAYERVVRLSPEFGADVWLKLGNIYYRRGDQETGRAAWERALAIDPHNEIARGNLGVSRPATSDSDAAAPIADEMTSVAKISAKTSASESTADEGDQDEATPDETTVMEALFGNSPPMSVAS